MSVDMTYPHIEMPEGQTARLRRTPRVRVAQIVMDYLAHGWSVDEMCRQHRYLSPAEAHAAMTYYFDHKAEIEAEIDAEWREVEQSQGRIAPPPFARRLKPGGLS